MFGAWVGECAPVPALDELKIRQYFALLLSFSLSTKHGSHHHCTPQPVAIVPDFWMLVTYATETELVIFVRSILSDVLIG